MVLGMSLAAFTAVHVVISLIAIVTGFVVVYGMLKANPLPIWTAVFLATTILTSVAGFLFPFEKLLPSHVFGIISLPVLALSVLGVYAFRLAGPWRWIYVVTSIFALYLNTFVLVVQSFQKVPFFRPLAPTQSEPPFAVAQLLVLVLCVVLGFLAVRRFRRSSAELALGGT
jgi:hypothetical protein